MKKLMLVLLLLVLVPCVAFAEPFLVCDPAPVSDQVTHSQVTVNGTAGAWVTYATANIGGTTVCVLQDLGPLVQGNYTVTAKFKNVWGESVASSPFTFTKALPGAPSSMGIRQ